MFKNHNAIQLIGFNFFILYTPQKLKFFCHIKRQDIKKIKKTKDVECNTI